MKRGCIRRKSQVKGNKIKTKALIEIMINRKQETDDIGKYGKSEKGEILQDEAKQIRNK